MDVNEAVFVTDGVNRHKMLLPLSELVASMETHLQACIRNGLPAGMPANLAHDQCRPIGWSVGRGVLIAKDMSRQLGLILRPTAKDETEKILNLISNFRFAFQASELEPFVEDLHRRLGDFMSNDVSHWHVEAAAAVGDGLAASMVPEFFSPDSALVDKDGLVDYAELLARTVQIQPGVFHEPERDVVVFAHRYFRRSLSLRNSLNQYVLRSFHAAATSGEDIVARFRLDPDLIGHPDSARAVMELEYWHGPLFDDDIASIPTGVAEHKSDESARIYSNIDKTQIWWKDPEVRRDAQSKAYKVRTFEIEELVDEPSPGLDRDHFGCRYAHAEYHLERAAVSHFDGAIRAYAADSYLERIGRRIDRAGKQANYTKLFRLDGNIPVPTWKRLLTDFYRGNRLIPEYLGAPPDGDSQKSSEEPEATVEARLPDLSAYIGLGLTNEDAPAAIRLQSDRRISHDGSTLAIAEVGQGSLAERLREWIETSDVVALVTKHSTANLAPIMLPGDPPQRDAWIIASQTVSDAIHREISEKRLELVSLAFSWKSGGILTTLSIAGRAELVGAVLEDVRDLVRPDCSGKMWVESFRDALLQRAPELDARVTWPNGTADIGKIVIPRADEFRGELMLPVALAT